MIDQDMRGTVIVRGRPGPKGDKGEAGEGIHIQGSVTTADDLPATGNTEGDGYLAQDTGHLWVWDGTAWVDAGEVRGPAGPAGPTAVSADGGNTAELGSDGLIYVSPGSASVRSVNGQTGEVTLTLDDVAQAGHVTPSHAQFGAPNVTDNHPHLTLAAFVTDDSQPGNIIPNGGLSFYAHSNGSTVAAGNLFNHNSAIIGGESSDAIGGATSHAVIGINDTTRPPTAPFPGGTMAYSDAGVLNLLQADGTTVAVTPSTDAGNLLSLGTDNGLYTPDPATTGPVWADADQAAETLFVNASSANNENLQGFAVDSINQRVYLVQTMQGGIQLDDEPAPLTFDERDAAGDMCFSRMSMDGTFIDLMYVRGIGHVASLGVDAREGENPTIWSGTDSSETTGNPTGIGYFTYSPSETTALDNAQITRFQPTGEPVDWSNCNIDPTTNRLVTMRNPSTSEWAFAGYPLDEAYEGVWNPVFDFSYFIRNRQQGMAAAGDHLYAWFGYPLWQDPEGNTVVMYRFDTETGDVMQAANVKALYGQVERREPEGVAVWLTDPADTETWQLGAGFGCTLDGAWTSSIVAWPAQTQTSENPAPGLEDVCRVANITTTEMSVGAPTRSTRAVNGTFIAYCQDESEYSPIIQGEVSFYAHRNGNVVTYGHHLANSSLAVGSTRVEDFGDGLGVIGLANTAAPPTAPSDTSVIAYAQDGVLRLLQSDGTAIAISPSADAGNRLTVGSDNGLYAGDILDPLCYEITPAAGYSVQSPGLFWYYQGGEIHLHGSVAKTDGTPFAAGYTVGIAAIAEATAFPVSAKTAACPHNYAEENPSGALRAEATENGQLSVYVPGQSPNILWVSFAGMTWPAVGFDPSGLSGGVPYSQAAVNGFA